MSIRFQLTMAVVVCLCQILTPAASAQPAKNILTIVDDSGKEHKLSSWQFAGGTRHLTWLASAEEKKAAQKSKTAAGLEVLDFSPGIKPPLRVRVLTLIPLESIRAIEYHAKKKIVTVRVATKDKDLVLEGLTGYQGVNVLSLTAETELGDLGKAQLRFRGGVSRGVKSLRFSAPKPLAPVPAGRLAHVVATDRAKTKHQAIGLQPIYSKTDRTLHLGAALHFQKTLAIGLDKIEKMSQVGSGAVSRAGLVFDVKLKNGMQKPLVLLERKQDAQKRAEFLIGLVGRVDAGYKLFPMQTIDELTFAER